LRWHEDEDMTLKIALCALGLLCGSNLAAVVSSEAEAVLERCKNEFVGVKAALGGVRVQFGENPVLINGWLQTYPGRDLLGRLSGLRPTVMRLQAQYADDQDDGAFIGRIGVLAADINLVYERIETVYRMKIVDDHSLATGDISNDDAMMVKIAYDGAGTVDFVTIGGEDDSTENLYVFPTRAIQC
jgi:hypothetical protein